MSYTKLGFSIIVVNLLIVLFTSCGGEDSSILATGNDVEITDDDFMNEFNRLIPEDQVGVLEPGGKLNLVSRLINKELFLAEAERNGFDGIEDWLAVSEDLWLARRCLEQEIEKMYEAGVDTNWIDSMISIDVSMSVVLMRDSTSAAIVMEDWKGDGPSEPDVEMAIAPWNIGGSSYLDFHGDFFKLCIGNSSFANDLITYAGEGVVLLPSFGVWAVCRIDTMHVDPGEYSISLAAQYYVSVRISEITDVTVLSNSIDELKRHMVLEGGQYSFRPGEDFNPDLTVAQYPGGMVTAGEIVEIAGLIRSENFFADVPDNFISYKMPQPLLEPEIDLWTYAEGIAEIRRLAEFAAENGVIWPAEELELTITEHIFRENVLKAAAETDTLTAIEFYYENQDMYDIPELRSILIAYVPFDWMPAVEIDSFDDLENYYVHADSSGDIVPTDPCPVELYGSYGEAVFEADSGVFTGPIEYGEDEVFVFFEVVEIIPEGEENPMLILPFIIEDCKAAMVTRRLESYLLELWNSYSIEIDSAAVRSVDPWASNY